MFLILFSVLFDLIDVLNVTVRTTAIPFEVNISWDKPADSSEIIVKYDIELNRVGSDVSVVK